MKTFERIYGGWTVRMALFEGQVLFNLIDCVSPAGYSRVASLRHHTKGKNREVILADGTIYLTAKTLVKIGRDASNLSVTPFANWATSVTNLILSGEQSKAAKKARKVAAKKPVVKKVAAPVKPAAATTTYVKQALPVETLIGLKEAAKEVNMTVGALSDWLVAQGYAGRYVSNNALFWKKWFKGQEFGKRPLIVDHKGTRESNVAKLTTKGLEFIKSRLASERESNVLSFATKEATARERAERERMEKEVDDLIVKTFAPHRVFKTYSGLGPDYRLDEHDLLKKAKEVIAQVKLKENSGLQGSNV